MIQVDHSSIDPTSTQLEICSLYKFLTHLERVKKLTQYKLSYTDCSRATSGPAENFTVTIDQESKYKCLGAEKAVSNKSFFSSCIEAVRSSEVLNAVFRWRYERVHSVCKIQKPYVMTVKPVQLKPNQPTQVA